jgi:hypothetical protein
MFPTKFASVTAEITMHSRHITKMDIYQYPISPNWWSLLQEHVVDNKLDIYDFITRKIQLCLIDWFWYFNATFNNISVISWRSGLVVEEAGVPGENPVSRVHIFL